MTYLQKRCSSCETGWRSRNLPSPTRGDCTTASSKKKLWISYEKFKMIKKKITSAFFSPLRDSLRYILVKCNGVMSREFAELWSVRASSRFLPCTGGFVLRFLLWKFSSAIYKGRFRNCSTGLYISPHEKKVKKKKRKKSLGRRQKKNVGRLWSYTGKSDWKLRRGKYSHFRISFITADALWCWTV